MYMFKGWGPRSRGRRKGRRRRGGRKWGRGTRGEGGGRTRLILNIKPEIKKKTSSLQGDTEKIYQMTNSKFTGKYLTL